MAKLGGCQSSCAHSFYLITVDIFLQGFGFHDYAQNGKVGKFFIYEKYMENLVNIFTCGLLVHQINMPIIYLPDQFKGIRNVFMIILIVLIVYSEMKFPD